MALFSVRVKITTHEELTISNFKASLRWVLSMSFIQLHVDIVVDVSYNWIS